MRTSTPQGSGSGNPTLKLGSVGLAAIGILILITIWLGIYRIDAGHVGIVKRFGNVIDVVDPGLRFKFPWADTVEEMEVRERAFSMTLEAASDPGDGQLAGQEEPGQGSLRPVRQSRSV
jgi:regulator of protease activity HflC (stomatin/prohibitin superfamily)